MHGIFFDPPIENNYLGHIFAEVYKDRVYAPFLEGKKDLVILDIGANIGVTAYYFSQFAKKVISVEPSKEHFEKLTQMIKFNGLSNVTAINKALFTDNSKHTFYHNNNRTMYSLNSSVRDPNLPTEEVDSISLDKLIESNNLDRVDFMKLDVEGSEAEILGSEGFKNCSKKIDTILVEVHAWNGRHPNQILESLKASGFTVQKIDNDATLILAKRNA